MRKKEIKQQIQSEIDAYIPNTPPKMDYAYIKALREQEDKSVALPKKHSAKTFNLRLAFSVLLMAVVAASVWFLTDTGKTPPHKLPKGSEVLAEDKDVLALSFLSNAAMIPNQGDEFINHNLSLNVNNNYHLLNNALPISPMDQLKPFLNLIESIITQSNGTVVEILPSDRAEYDTYIEVTSIDLVGNPVVYKMYYHVTQYEKFDDETIYQIEGIIHKNGIDYPMYGKKEIEEDETTITMRSMLNTTSYIETVYEFDQEESEYYIKYIEHNKTVYESQLEIEIENDEIEISLEIYNQNKLAKYELNYETEDGRPLIEIEFEIEDFNLNTKTSGEMKVFVTIDQIANLNQYDVFITIEDETYEERYDRDIDDDDDDDDDDDLAYLL